jgi:hypothetical protein
LSPLQALRLQHLAATIHIITAITDITIAPNCAQKPGA